MWKLKTVGIVGLLIGQYLTPGGVLAQGSVGPQFQINSYTHRCGVSPCHCGGC